MFRKICKLGCLVVWLVMPVKKKRLVMDQEDFFSYLLKKKRLARISYWLMSLTTPVLGWVYYLSFSCIFCLCRGLKNNQIIRNNHKSQYCFIFISFFILSDPLILFYGGSTKFGKNNAWIKFVIASIFLRLGSVKAKTLSLSFNN